MSEFWDSKWLAWDITRSEFKLAKGAKAGLLGYKNNEKAATFVPRPAAGRLERLPRQ